jgi:uncharacterized protein YbjT (DUF2867 family)
MLSGMFTIFGATGNTGSVVAERLLAAGKQVRAVVRSADKGAALAARGAELVVGSVTDARVVARALAGAEGAYLMLPPDPASPDLLAQNRGIVDNYVAGIANVPHAVFLSSTGAQRPTGTGPIQTCYDGEQRLTATATKMTLLRASSFMENLLGLAHPIKADGILPVFGGGETYPFAMNATRDIGDVAADALLSPPSVHEWIELRGPREYSYVDAAAIAANIVGRPVAVTVLPFDQMVPMLAAQGMSESFAKLVREMTEAFQNGLTFENKGRQLRGKVELADVLAALR